MSHNYINDDGVKFQIIPSTRKITVPASHKIIGTVGDHNSEQLTFQCPKTIDGHDVVNCSDHYISWKNAAGGEGYTDVVDIRTDEENMYFTWLIDSGVTVAAGYVTFAVHFEDIDTNGATLYKWSTTTCGECQVLDALNHKETTVVVPDGYLKPTGTKNVTANGTFNVAEYKAVNVAVPDTIPEGYIQPSGVKDITKNGEYDVTEYAATTVDVQPTLQTKTITENGTYTADNGYDGLSAVVVNVAVSQDDPVIQTLEVTENGTYAVPDGVDGYGVVTVNVPIPDGYVRPSGTLEVDENGTFDVLGYASVDVNVPETALQGITITENGTYEPQDGYAYNKVIVNVAGSTETIEEYDGTVTIA